MTEDQFISTLINQNKTCVGRIPNKQLAQQFADNLYQFMFGCGRAVNNTEENLHDLYKNLKKQLDDLLNELNESKDEIGKNTNDFFASLPFIYKKLLKDAEAVVIFDPAAESLEEVLAAYPGIYAIAIYRISHQLHLQGVKTLPRILGEYAHSITGIDIHPAASIGESFFIDHGTGIVIGGTAVIGNNVKIYQGVTLGALNVSKELAKVKRHPTIEDDVIIYSGATILGGDTIIGKNSVIGGNVWLTNSVLPNSIVYHKSEVSIRDKFPFQEDALNFVI
jgi:serine O-acetyltransferase